MYDLNDLRDSFTQSLPDLRQLARSRFFGLDPEARQEAVTNALALTWMFIHRLFLKGRAEEPGILNSCLWYAIKHTKEGRTPQGCPMAKDAFQKRRLGKVRFEEFDLNNFVGRSTPVFEHAAFRVDVPAFLDTLNDRQRKMAIDLAWGMTTKAAAKKYGVTPGAVSQFRARFKKLFDEFFAE